MTGVCENNNLVIRWTFGETESRPTSLQAFDMLHCSVSFAKLLFPNARKVICYNSLKSEQSLKRLKDISAGIELIESKANLTAEKGKNSFWKYFPLRLDNTKYELVLDNDVVFWNVPPTLNEWLDSGGLLLNTDWNGKNYGEFQVKLSGAENYNAGIIGYPPAFEFALPEFSDLSEHFHSEQGFIVKTFVDSCRPIFAITKSEVFQANSEEMRASNDTAVKRFAGGHFCGCSYGHYFDWDKLYKDKIWNEYFKRCAN